MLFKCFFICFIKSLGWTNIEISLPTAFNLSRTSLSLKNKFKGLPLISVRNHVVNDKPSIDAVFGDSPCRAATLLGKTSLISAVFPSWIIPKFCPSDDR